MTPHHQNKRGGGERGKGRGKRSNCHLKKMYFGISHVQSYEPIEREREREREKERKKGGHQLLILI
jgi:hypothetical protein